jgi:hypothetical protein
MTEFCMVMPRRKTMSTRLSMVSTLATEASAAYSPSEWPAKMQSSDGMRPRSRMSSNAASSTSTSAGCENCVAKSRPSGCCRRVRVRRMHGMPHAAHAHAHAEIMNLEGVRRRGVGDVAEERLLAGAGDPLRLGGGRGFALLARRSGDLLLKLLLDLAGELLVVLLDLTAAAAAEEDRDLLGVLLDQLQDRETVFLLEIFILFFSVLQNELVNQFQFLKK